jgi:hypothetical protein
MAQLGSGEFLVQKAGLYARGGGLIEASAAAWKRRPEPFARSRSLSQAFMRFSATRPRPIWNNDATRAVSDAVESMFVTSREGVAASRRNRRRRRR